MQHSKMATDYVWHQDEVDFMRQVSSLSSRSQGFADILVISERNLHGK